MHGKPAKTGSCCPSSELATSMDNDLLVSGHWGEESSGADESNMTDEEESSFSWADSFLPKKELSAVEQLGYAPSNDGAIKRPPYSSRALAGGPSGEILEAEEYADDILRYHRSRESSLRIRQDFLSSQPEITPGLREKMVDWLVQVHAALGLMPDTLYLAVYIMDKFVELTECFKSRKYQLLGLAALHIAAKYEEVSSPLVRDLLYQCDGNFNRRQLQNMEMHILRALDFRVSVPTSFTFLLEFLQKLRPPKRIVLLAFYITERMLQDHRMLAHHASVTALASLAVACRVLDIRRWEGQWMKEAENLCHQMRCSEDFYPALDSVVGVMWMADPQKCIAVYRKWSTAKMGHISRVKTLSNKLPAQAAYYH